MLSSKRTKLFNEQIDLEYSLIIMDKIIDYNSATPPHYQFRLDLSPEFRIEWIKLNPNYKLWNWDYISGHNNFKIEWVSKYPHKPWNWVKISRVPNLKVRWLDLYPNKDCGTLGNNVIGDEVIKRFPIYICIMI